MADDRARNDQSEPFAADEPGVQPGEAVRALPTLSTAEAAAALELSEQAIRRAIARGDLGAVKRGSGYRIRAEELARYAQELNRPIPLIPRARIVALPTSAEARHSFPTPASPFVGRDAELAALLTDPTTRLITLTGPGGIGKTRLALAIASSMEDCFADGALFVDLSDITSPADAVPAIAQALGLRERAGQDRRSQLYAFLRGKQLLLALDNFEQIIDAAPAVPELLAQAPRVAILITSRAPLRVRGERAMPVPPLALAGANATPDELLTSDAGRLFVARAQGHDPAFIVDERTAPLIAEICARLDGLPLAIELAAARSRTLRPRQLRDRLERRLPLLTRGARNVPKRHLTMRDAIAWSYDLLSPEEQDLFRHLAVFAGGCSLEAAEAVGSWLLAIGLERNEERESEVGSALSATSSQQPTANGQQPITLDRIDSLLDQSLLVRDFGVDGELRFRMLETIREYGVEQVQPDEARAVRTAHASYFCEFAQVLRPLVNTQATSVAFDRLAADDANLRAALVWLHEHGPAADFVALVAACSVYWYALSHLREAATWFERALAEQDQAAARDRARLMMANAEHLMVRGNYADAEAVFVAGLPLVRAAGDPFDIAMALFTYGVCLTFAGNAVAGEDALGQALAAAEAIANPTLRAAVTAGALANLGVTARSRGDLALAESRSEEALRLRDAMRFDLAAIRSLFDLGDIAREQGNYRLAAERFLTCIQRTGERGEKRLIADALSGIASAAAAWGQSRTALLLFAAADALRERVGIAMSLPNDAAATARDLATLREALGDEQFAVLWSEGRAMPLTEALQVAATVTPSTESPQGAPAVVDSPLTRREQDVLQLLAAGQTDREIADALFIGPRTVSWHVGAIIGKLGAATRREAVARARADGLV